MQREKHPFSQLGHVSSSLLVETVAIGGAQHARDSCILSLSADLVDKEAGTLGELAMIVDYWSNCETWWRRASFSPSPVEKTLMANCAIHVFADRRRPEHDVPGFEIRNPSSQGRDSAATTIVCPDAGLQDELDTGR
jgi:hypothetical protein